MRDFLATPEPDDGKRFFYPMNGTGDLGTEGYGQLLPIAAIEASDPELVTIMPASSYNSLNVETVDQVNDELEKRVSYDQQKAGFLEGYLADAPIEVDAWSSDRMFRDDRFWEQVMTVLKQYSCQEIREKSPLPDRIAEQQDLGARSYIEAIGDSYDIPIDDDRASGYAARDLYLPFQAAEAAVAQQEGYDVKLGIGQEEPFDELTEAVTGIETVRSVAPLDDTGDPIVPYSERYTEQPQLRILEEPTAIDLGSIAPETQDQYIETAFCLDAGWIEPVIR